MKLSPSYQAILQESGVDLSQYFEAPETALPQHAARLAVDVLREDGFPILGGDVYYRVQNGEVGSTSENWSSSPRADESIRDYIERSCDETLAYVCAFDAPEGVEPLFVFVVSEYFGYRVFGGAPG